MNTDRRTFLATSVAASLTAVGPNEWIPPVSAQTTKSPAPSFAFDQQRLAAGKKIPVIFDTDIGNDIDDTWALLYLLNSPELDVKLISVERQGSNDRAKIVAKFLEAVGRADIPIAVGPQPDGETNQSKWVADYSLDAYPGVVHDNAADAIVRTINTSPEPITLIAVGPVPVVAQAVRKDPFICKNARFVGMHGSIYRGYNNAETPSPEFNVRVAPAALRTVFEGDWECSITPLDTCGLLRLVGERYKKFAAARSPGVRAILENYRIWLSHAGWVKDPTMIERQSSILFDIVAATMAFSEQWMQVETLPIHVDDDGMTVVTQNDGRPVRCALRWRDYDAYLDHVVERLLTEK